MEWSDRLLYAAVFLFIAAMAVSELRWRWKMQDKIDELKRRREEGVED